MASKPSVSFEDLVKDFTDQIDACECVMPGSLDSTLQVKMVDEMQAYITQVRGYKWQAINLGHREVADKLFHFQCIAQAMQAYLQIWIEFKAGKYEDAWGFLIDAYEFTGVAAKAYDANLNRVMLRRLEEVEHALFPSFAVYFSGGFVETIGNCSICEQNFMLCDHLENHVYAGRLCQRTGRKITQVDHFAMVDAPRDRRCIIPEVENDTGEMVSRFTGLITGPAGDSDAADSDGAAGRRARGTMLNMKSLPFD